MLLRRHGYEYRLKGSKTPFETFTKYTDEKINTSLVLARIVEKKFEANYKKRKIKVLDIGSGDGILINLILKYWHKRPEIQLTLIEPSQYLLPKLIKNIKNFPVQKSNISKLRWEQFKTVSKFDLILAIHRYHIKVSNYKKETSRMLSLLKQKGFLIIVSHGYDDVYRFKRKFKSPLAGKNFEPRTVNQILEVFKNLDPIGHKFKIDRYKSESYLNFPSEINDDFRTLVEFYINKPWIQIPIDIKGSIIKYISKKKHKLRQIDEVLVIHQVL